MLTPRKLMRHLADCGHTVHVVATDFNVYNEQNEPEEEYVSSLSGRLAAERLRLSDILDRYTKFIEAVVAGGGGQVPVWEPF
jgi:hypothetical protein